MDQESIRTIFLLILMIAASGYFSASETAFTSVNRIRLQNEAEKGDKSAKRALDLTNNYDSVLSTILVGNNLVNILSSSLATLLFVKFFPTYGVTLSTIIMTIVVLIFGEISPKTIAKESATSFAKFSAPILKALMVLLRPVNWFFTQWKKLLDRIFHFEDADVISEEELISIVNEAESGGGIDDYEVELIRSAIEFNDMEAGNILTPRVDVVGADIDDPVEEIEELFNRFNYSRIIIYDDSIDNIIGVLHEKDFNRLLRRAQKRKQEPSISSIIKEVIFVPPSMALYKLLRSMQFNQLHMAAVTDEYGGTIGIVTLEDILEELVGEIWDESDIIREEVKEMKDGSYKVMGGTSLEKVFDLFKFDNLDDEDFISNTVSGFVTEMLGRIPEEGDTFIYKDIKVTILKTQDRRVLEVKLEKMASSEENEENEKGGKTSNH